MVAVLFNNRGIKKFKNNDMLYCNIREYKSANNLKVGDCIGGLIIIKVVVK